MFQNSIKYVFIVFVLFVLLLFIILFTHWWIIYILAVLMKRAQRILWVSGRALINGFVALPVRNKRASYLYTYNLGCTGIYFFLYKHLKLRPHKTLPALQKFVMPVWNVCILSKKHVHMPFFIHSQFQLCRL